MVHLKVDFDWSSKPLHDVIATIPGSVYKDQWIIYGNHHDAWVNGAIDPASGAAVLLETARTLAMLRKQGWQPKRTIVLALWDGEEFGLMGSTEWVEKHEQELERKAAVYINSDSTGRGRAGGGRLGIARNVRQGSAARHARSRRWPPRRFSFISAGRRIGLCCVSGPRRNREPEPRLRRRGRRRVYHSAYDTMAWFTASPMATAFTGNR